VPDEYERVYIQCAGYVTTNSCNDSTHQTNQKTQYCQRANSCDSVSKTRNRCHWRVLIRMNRIDERAEICDAKHKEDVDVEVPGSRDRLLVDTAEFCQSVCICICCLCLAEGGLGVT
jgi:hypothetical protein